MSSTDSARPRRRRWSELADEVPPQKQGLATSPDEGPLQKRKRETPPDETLERITRLGNMEAKAVPQALSDEAVLSNAISALRLVKDLGRELLPLAPSAIGINSSGQPFLMSATSVTYKEEFEEALAAQTAKIHVVDTASKFLDQVFKLPGISSDIPELWTLVKYATQCMEGKRAGLSFQHFETTCRLALTKARPRIRKAKEAISAIQKAGSVGEWTKDTLKSTVELLCLDNSAKLTLNNIIMSSSTPKRLSEFLTPKLQHLEELPEVIEAMEAALKEYNRKLASV